MKNILKEYLSVPAFIKHLIMAVFFIQLIDAASFILFNYYLHDLGFKDDQIAYFTACRYAAIVLVSFPFGLYIKGRPLIHFIRIASFMAPLISLGIIFLLESGQVLWAQIFIFFLGLNIVLIKVTALPFIILNTPTDKHSESIAMYFQVFSLTVFTAGVSNYILSSIDRVFFSEKNVLIIISLLGFFASYFAYRINIIENVSEKIPMRQFMSKYDWRKIIKVSVPTFLIAFGAGLTIPFINLFFLQIHGVASQTFSLFGAFSFGLVAISMVFVPRIRRFFGYNLTVNGFQTLAIIALVLLATTQWYAHLEWALYVAVIAYVLRQPLMNFSSPVVSEWSLYFVGKRNQEMMGAINASIWSGSWFFSSLIFGWMRASSISFVNIFLITATSPESCSA